MARDNAVTKKIKASSDERNSLAPSLPLPLIDNAIRLNRAPNRSRFARFFTHLLSSPAVDVAERPGSELSGLNFGLTKCLNRIHIDSSRS